MKAVALAFAGAVTALGASSSFAQVALKTPTTTAELKTKADIADLVARIKEIPEDKAVMEKRHDQFVAQLPRDPANIAESRRRAKRDAQEMIQALQILEREREDKAKEAIRLTCEL